jgi:hypothetical protein
MCATHTLACFLLERRVYPTSFDERTEMDLHLSVPLQEA